MKGRSVQSHFHFERFAFVDVRNRPCARTSNNALSSLRASHHTCTRAVRLRCKIYLNSCETSASSACLISHHTHVGSLLVFSQQVKRKIESEIKEAADDRAFASVLPFTSPKTQNYDQQILTRVNLMHDALRESGHAGSLPVRLLSVRSVRFARYASEHRHASRVERAMEPIDANSCEHFHRGSSCRSIKETIEEQLVSPRYQRVHACER
jgi:hypothetical protein